MWTRRLARRWKRCLLTIWTRACFCGATLASLPADFFHARLPQGFATTSANSFDITSIDGYKLYRLRQAYGQGFGQLVSVNNPRYIQIGLKFFF